MKSLAFGTSVLCALAGLACNDGSQMVVTGSGGSMSVQGSGGMVTSAGTGGNQGSGGMVVSAGTGGSQGSASGGTSAGQSGGTTATGTGGGNIDPTGTGGVGSGGSTGTGGTAASTGGSGGRAMGTGGAGTGGTPAGTGGSVATGDLRSGPFKMLVLSKCLEFAHDSIMTGQTMLMDLGKTSDAMLPAGAVPGSQFTVTIAKDDLSDFSEANLKNYEIIFWMNPTGTVFSSGGVNGTAGMAAIQKFMESGGAWGGVHSATDFEKTGKWKWFQDTVGGYFNSHDGDGTAGTVVIQAAALSADNPVIRGIKNPWSTTDEWYYMNRNPETLPGYSILGKLSSDMRPVIWTHDISGGGRMFYTIRGHNKKVFAEADFRKLVHQGILWAVHRMK